MEQRRIMATTAGMSDGRARVTPGRNIGGVRRIAVVDLVAVAAGDATRHIRMAGMIGLPERIGTDAELSGPLGERDGDRMRCYVVRSNGGAGPDAAHLRPHVPCTNGPGLDWSATAPQRGRNCTRATGLGTQGRRIGRTPCLHPAEGMRASGARATGPEGPGWSLQSWLVPGCDQCPGRPPPPAHEQ